MKKSIKRNIDAFKNIRDSKRGKIPNAILGKVNNIVELYEQRKIIQKATAENLTNNISTNNPKKRAKALEEHETKIEKYEASTPAGERMADRAQKAREGRQIKNVRIRLREKTKASAVPRLMKQAQLRGIGNRKIYSIEYTLYSLEPIGAIVRGKKQLNLFSNVWKGKTQTGKY